MSLNQGKAVTILAHQGHRDQIEVVMFERESRQGWAYGNYLAIISPKAATVRER